MSSDLPRGIRVESTVSGVRFVAPRENRPTDWATRLVLSWFALGLTFFTVIFFFTFFSGTRISHLPLFVFVALIFAMLDLLACWGLVLGFSRPSIEVSRDGFILDRGFGHAHRILRKSHGELRSLRIHFEPVSISARKPPFKQDDLFLWSPNRCLVIDWLDGGKSWRLYTAASLHHSLAVAARFNDAVRQYLPVAAPDDWPPIVIEDPGAIRGVASDVPADSSIRLVEDEIGITIRVPPKETGPVRTALWKLGGLFAAFWSLPLGVLVAINVDWWGYPILAGVAAGHACLMFEAFRKRRAELEIVADGQGLRLIENTIGRRREHAWKGEEIRSVELWNGSAGSEEEALLLIDAANGPGRFMKQHPPIHIMWVVWAIYRALGWDRTRYM